MARGKKSGSAEGLIDLVALLPWWLGVLLAIVSYVVLHQVALQPSPASLQPGEIQWVMISMAIKTIATIGQYALSLICLLGACLSAWKRNERKALLTRVTQSSAADVLNSMSWQQFERLVGEAFARHGYSVLETGGGGADGGVDLLLAKGSEKFLVQCKQWKAFKVGVDVVRELYGVMAAKGAAGGFVVTSGRFTAEATAFASGRNVELVDGPRLLALIKQVDRPAAERPAARTSPKPERAAAPSAALSAPTCPACSKPMVTRTAKRGANAGKEFWGCTAYPSCKGTKPIL